MDSIILTQEQLQEMLAHVDAHAPLEACGLLAGRGARVEKILTATNQAQSRTRYMMEPVEQLHAFEWIEANELELIGIFHSHPNGPETPSPTDIAEAYYQVVYLILSRADKLWRVRGFWIQAGTYREVEIIQT